MPKKGHTYNMLFFTILFSFAVCIFCQYFWQKKFNYGVSLTALYAFIWGNIWLIQYSGIMEYFPLSEEAVLLSVIPLIGSLSAEFFLFLFCYNKSEGNQQENKIIDNIDAKKLKFLVLFFGFFSVLLGLILLFSAFQIYGNVLLHGKILKDSRSVQGTSIFAGATFYFIIKYLGILRGVFFSATILGALYILLINRKYWLGIVLPLSGAILFCLGWGSRSSIFTVFLILLAVFVCAPIKKPFNIFSGRGIKFMFLVIILIIIPVIYSMDRIGTATREKQTLNVNGVNLPFSIVQFVNYNVGTINCFDSTIDDNPCTYGRMSFAGIEHWLYLFRIIPRSVDKPDSYYNWEYEYPYMSPYFRGNTYSWLRYLYSDFGILGLFIVPWLITFIGTLSAFKFHEYSNKIGLLIIYIICTLIYLRSNMLMWFRDDYFIFMLFVLYFTTKIISPKHKKKRVVTNETNIVHSS